MFRDKTLSLLPCGNRVSSTVLPRALMLYTLPRNASTHINGLNTSSSDNKKPVQLFFAPQMEIELKQCFKIETN